MFYMICVSEISIHVMKIQQIKPIQKKQRMQVFTTTHHAKNIQQKKKKYDYRMLKICYRRLLVQHGVYLHQGHGEYGRRHDQYPMRRQMFVYLPTSPQSRGLWSFCEGWIEHIGQCHI